VRDGEGAVTAGSECATSGGIEAIGVHSLANGNGGENFAGIAVDGGLCQNVQPSADLETELAECSMMSPCGCCWWKMIPEFCVSS
jgi:hypothetical protein